MSSNQSRVCQELCYSKVEFVRTVPSTQSWICQELCLLIEPGFVNCCIRSSNTSYQELCFLRKKLGWSITVSVLQIWFILNCVFSIRVESVKNGVVFSKPGLSRTVLSQNRAFQELCCLLKARFVKNCAISSKPGLPKSVSSVCQTITMTHAFGLIKKEPCETYCLFYITIIALQKASNCVLDWTLFLGSLQPREQSLKCDRLI